jgi:hypothetical protein
VNCKSSMHAKVPDFQSLSARVSPYDHGEFEVANAPVLILP